MKTGHCSLPGLALLLSCAGCGEVVGVSGTVTQAGKPVDSATILFIPDGTTNGPSATGKITNGRFSIPANAGLQTGQYIIKVKRDSSPHRWQPPLVPVQAYEFKKEVKGASTPINLEL